MKNFYLIILLVPFFLFAQKNPTESYNKLVSLYKSMREDSSQNKLRHNYVRFARYFSTFNKNHATFNPKREYANFYQVIINNDLAFVSGKKSDLIIAYNTVESFLAKSYNSVLNNQARFIKKGIRELAHKKNIKQIIDDVQNYKEFGEKLKKSFTYIKKIVQHKNSITIHSDREISYYMKTSEDLKKKIVTIDVQNAKIAHEPIRVMRRDSRINSIKYFQHTPKIVRIIYEFDKKLYPVVTITNKGMKSNFAARPFSIYKKVNNQLFNKFRVLLDPGHGGADPGTIKNGLMEKHITLSIAKKLGYRLKKAGFDVRYTRTTDKTLSLNQRSNIAREIKPDIFISIHLNSSRKKNVFGIETYYFDVKGDETTMRIAARENENSGKISDIDFILKDLTLSKNFLDAGALASIIQKELFSGVSKKYRSNLKNRGTRGGPFYVLYRTGIPSILIEAGFLSNKNEAKRLITKNYQRLIATQIASGVKKYAKKTIK